MDVELSVEDAALSAKLEEIWQQLHAMPEPAFCEVRTAAFLTQKLRQYGYTVTENVGEHDGEQGTGVIAVFDSGVPDLLWLCVPIWTV